MSIIPGIENIDPERTDTSSGSAGSPSLRPMARSSFRSCLATASDRPAGSLPESMNSRQASVEIVKPGGTGRPRLVISARFAPLPPRRYFISRLPSAKS